jgi:hypothetical protein
VDARSGAKFNRSSDSAALVEVTNEAHLSYAKLCIPVDHWIHPWGLSAIKHQGKDEIRTGIGDHPPGALLGARGTAIGNGTSGGGRRGSSGAAELEAVKLQATKHEAEVKAKADEVVSKANKYSRSPLPALKGKAGTAGKSMRRTAALS